jgi:DNA-binding NtrC family response regulator/ABC-type branched-subunit amino acid transport system substrate-binding protein
MYKDSLKDIKIGILFSLTGTTGITERGQYQACLLAIKQINDTGGINGKRLVPIVEDIASDPYLAAKKSEKLILSDQVVTLVGLYTSACRKMVIPVLEKYDSLLLYPTQYEGEEQHRNIVYCGSTPNQQLSHFIPWIIENLGKSFYLIGSDYVYPREINRYIRYLLESHNGIIVGENYSSLGNQRYHKYLKEIQQLNPDVIFSTLVGDSAVAFYQQFHQYGLKQPIASSITAETEITAIQTPYARGHYSCFPYFNTIKSKANQEFITQYRRTYGTDNISSAMENAYNSIILLAEALKKSKKMDTDSLRYHLPGLTFEAPQGKIKVDPKNQHLWLHSRIGQVNQHGQFDIIWESEHPIPPIPFLKKNTVVTDRKNILTEEGLQKKLVYFEPLIYELKKATQFLPCSFLLFDYDGFLLDKFCNDTVISPMLVNQINKGENIKNLPKMDNTGVILSFKSQTISFVSGKEHNEDELDDWISIGVPIKGEGIPFHGVLGVFSNHVHLSHTDLLIGYLSQIVKYCVDFSESQKKLEASNRFMQDVSQYIADSLFIIQDQNIIFKNERAHILYNHHRDFIDTIIADALRINEEETTSLLKRGYSGELYEIRIIHSKPYTYLYIKQLSHKSSTISIRNKNKLLTSDLVGANEKFLKVVSLAKSASKTSANVLILGESGTGKELFARAIHNESERHNKPFVAVNCAAISRDLINAELFGYEEGAFTGAKKGGNPGKFEVANGGTLFLDEIGDMPIELQATLLRVLQEKEVIRVGGHKAIPIDVRIIAATNKDLNQEIAYKGSFRSDLFYRLNVFTIELMPLRERTDDIPLLVSHFLKDLSYNSQSATKNLTVEALEVLMNHNWKGNIRELNNVIERAFYIADNSPTITVEHLPQYVLQKITGSTEVEHELSISNALPDNVKQIKQNNKILNRNYLLQELIKRKGNISKTAKELGISRPTLYRKLKEYNINI